MLIYLPQEPLIPTHLANTSSPKEREISMTSVLRIERLADTGVEEGTDTRGIVPDKTHRMLRTILLIITIIASGGSDDTGERRYISPIAQDGLCS